MQIKRCVLVFIAGLFLSMAYAQKSDYKWLVNTGTYAIPFLDYVNAPIDWEVGTNMSLHMPIKGGFYAGISLHYIFDTHHTNPTNHFYFAGPSLLYLYRFGNSHNTMQVMLNTEMSNYDYAYNRTKCSGGQFSCAVESEKRKVYITPAINFQFPFSKKTERFKFSTGFFPHIQLNNSIDVIMAHYQVGISYVMSR